MFGCREKFDPLSSKDSNDNNNSGGGNAAIQVLSPRAGDSFQTGSDLVVKWQIFGTVTSLRVQLFIEDQYVRTIRQSTTESEGLFSWPIPSSMTSSSKYRIKIVDGDNSDNYTFSDTFTIFQNN